MKTRHILSLTAALLLIAPVAQASGGFKMNEHGFYIIDFVVLIGALWYFVRRPAKQFLIDRHDAVKAEMDEATSLKTEAEARLTRYDAQLAGLEAEIAGIREQFRKDGEAERERIIADANTEADRIRRDAEKQVSYEASKLRKILEDGLASRAMDLAEKKVKERITPTVQSQLVRGFVAELEARDNLNTLAG